MVSVDTYGNSTGVVLLHPNQLHYLQEWFGEGYLGVLATIRDFPTVSKTYSYIDFDDTLNYRGRQLQHPLLQDNRGDIGTSIAIEFFKTQAIKFLQCLSKDSMSRELSDLLNKTPASILTASAAPGFQQSKINVSFPNADKIITKKGIDKPKAILKHILTREVIPTRIDIFDDRTNNFYGVQDKKRGDIEMRVLSTLFPQTEFTLYYVEYGGREGEPTITKDRVWQSGKCTYTYNPHVVSTKAHERVGELAAQKEK